MFFCSTDWGDWTKTLKGRGIFSPPSDPGRIVDLACGHLALDCFEKKGEEKLDRHRMPRKRQEYVQLAFIVIIPVIILTAFAVRAGSDDFIHTSFA